MSTASTTITTVTVTGTIAGQIWMPAVTCGKTFKLTSQPGPWGDFHYSDGSRPTLREMILRATGDGDFQSCQVIDATVRFERVTQTLTGSKTRTRNMDIRQFPGVADCVAELDSEAYWAGVDCFSEVEA